MMFSSDQPSNAGDGALEVSQPLVVQNFPIVLVSIMSAFYQNPETLKYMMEWMRDQHHSDIPIVYLCGDTVYRNTQHCLFPSGGRDPIERGRTNWKKKYDDIIEFFRGADKIIYECDAYWENVKDASYLEIKKFTDLACASALNMESLVGSFPSSDRTVLESLLNDIQTLDLNQMVGIVASEFKDKNSGKLKKQERKQNGEAKRISLVSNLVRSQLVELGVEPKEHQAIDESVQNKENDALLEATRAYLAEEYAVFMSLCLPTDIGSIAAKCGLAFPSLNATTPIRPSLYYPITATKGSDLIFSVFQKIRDIYIRYAEILGLPTLTQEVTITDLVIPQNIHPSRLSAENQKTSGLLESNHTVSLTKVASSVFYCPSVNDFEVKETAEKIIRMIDSHCESVDRGVHKSTKLKYKNGVECHIEVEKSLNLPAITPVDSSLLDIQREDVKKTIQEAIYSVKSGALEEIEQLIMYLGYEVKLQMRPTMLSLGYSSGAPRVLSR